MSKPKFKIRIYNEKQAGLEEYLGDGEENIVIPSKINGYEIVGIEPHCFKEHYEIKTMVLPKTIQFLSDEIFKNDDDRKLENFHIKVYCNTKAISSFTDIAFPNAEIYIGPEQDPCIDSEFDALFVESPIEDWAGDPVDWEDYNYYDNFYLTTTAKIIDYLVEVKGLESDFFFNHICVGYDRKYDRFGKDVKVTAEGLHYFVNRDGSVVITHPDTPYDMPDKEIVIPKQIDGHPVAAIGFKAFCFARFEKMILPDSVQVIAALAFAGAKYSYLQYPEKLFRFSCHSDDRSGFVSYYVKTFQDRFDFPVLYATSWPCITKYPTEVTTNPNFSPKNKNVSQYHIDSKNHVVYKIQKKDGKEVAILTSAPWARSLDELPKIVDGLPVIDHDNLVKKQISEIKKQQKRRDNPKPKKTVKVREEPEEDSGWAEEEKEDLSEASFPLGGLGYHDEEFKEVRPLPTSEEHEFSYERHIEEKEEEKKKKEESEKQKIRDERNKLRLPPLDLSDEEINSYAKNISKLLNYKYRSSNVVGYGKQIFRDHLFYDIQTQGHEIRARYFNTKYEYEDNEDYMVVVNVLSDGRIRLSCECNAFNLDNPNRLPCRHIYALMMEYLRICKEQNKGDPFQNTILNLNKGKDNDTTLSPFVMGNFFESSVPMGPLSPADLNVPNFYYRLRDFDLRLKEKWQTTDILETLRVSSVRYSSDSIEGVIQDLNGEENHVVCSDPYGESKCLVRCSCNDNVETEHFCIHALALSYYLHTKIPWEQIPASFHDELAKKEKAELEAYQTPSDMYQPNFNTLEDFRDFFHPENHMSKEEYEKAKIVSEKNPFYTTADPTGNKFWAFYNAEGENKNPTTVILKCDDHHLHLYSSKTRFPGVPNQSIHLRKTNQDMQESIDWDRCINRLTVGLWLLWNARKPIPNETDVVLSRKFMDSASTDKIDPELIQSIRREEEEEEEIEEEEEEETPQSLESKAPIEPTIHVADKTFPSSPKQDEKLSQKTTEETIQPIKAKPESTSSVAFGELNLSNETTKKSSPEATPVRTEATNENRNNSPIPAPSKNFSPQRKSGMDDKEEHFTPRSSVEAPLFVEDKLRKEAPKASAPKKEQKLSFTSATANNNKKSPEEASTVHGFLNQQSTTLPTKDTPLNETPREKTSQSQNIVHPAPVTAKHESNQPSISVNGPRDQRQPSNVQKQTLPKEENNDKQEEKRKITTWICVIVIFSVLLIPILVAIFL